MAYDPFQQYSLAPGRMYGGGIGIGPTRIATGQRGNPEYLGGAVDVNIAGQNLRIPNAVIQQIFHDVSSNQGRTQISDYFGKNNHGVERPYSSYATLQKTIDQYAPENSRLWAAGRPISALDEPMYQQRALNRDLMDLGSGPLTEQRDAAGNLIGGTALQAQELRKRSRNIIEPNSRIQTLERQRASQPIYDIMDQIRKFQPTTSNLPITERIVA